MGASKKGKRRLVVDGVTYYWQARGIDYGGIVVSVATDEAFVSGQRGQWLHFGVPYDELSVASEFGWSLRQRSAVTPALVRRAIELARGLEPPFSGRAGLPDLRLPTELEDSLLPKEPIERVRADLGLASKVLEGLVADATDAGVTEARLARGGEEFCSLCLALLLELERAREPEPAARVEAWFRAAAPSLERIVPCVQAALGALAQTLEKSWLDWQQQWRQSCERRSALAAFVELCARARLGTLAARVDTAAVDARLRAPREHEGRATLRRPPYDAPTSHWWWSVDSPAR